MAITATAQRPPAELADPTEGGESETVRWLVGEAVGLPLIRQIVGEFCRRLAAEGVPLQRVLVSLRTLHPELATVGYLWQRGEPDVREVARGHDIFATPLYQNSPIDVHRTFIDEVKKLQVTVFNTMIRDRNMAFAAAGRHGVPTIMAPAVPTEVRGDLRGAVEELIDFLRRL